MFDFYREENLHYELNSQYDRYDGYPRGDETQDFVDSICGCGNIGPCELCQLNIELASYEPPTDLDDTIPF